MYVPAYWLVLAVLVSSAVTVKTPYDEELETIVNIAVNKEEYMKDKQTKRGLLVCKSQCSEVVCTKCEHGALTQMW